jgi:bla regulator protein blaR1
MTGAIASHLAESTIFALVLSAAALSFRRVGPSGRHALWLGAAVKFAIPAAALVSLGADLAARIPVSAVPVLPAPILDAIAVPAAAEPGLAPLKFTATLGLIWAAVTAMLLGSWIGRLWKLPRLALSPAGEYAEMLNEARRRMQITRSVAIYACTSPETLGVYGVLRPAIALPTGLRSVLTPEEMEAILMHELAHVRRWDNFAAIFVHVLVCVFWFHPLLWWIERRMKLECEHACDEAVLKGGAGASIYVSAILKVCRFSIDRAVPGISGAVGSQLRQRMELIMSLSNGRRSVITPRTLLGAVAAAMIVTPLLSGFLQTSAYAQSASAAGSAPSQGDCVANSKRYPKGTVVQNGRRAGAPKMECVGGRWARTDKPASEVVDEPVPVKVVCTPAASAKENECACTGYGGFSLGAIVDSPNGKLRCDKFMLGQFSTWRAATAKDLGLN